MARPESNGPLHRTVLELASRLVRTIASDPIPILALLVSAAVWFGLGDAISERVYDVIALSSQLFPQFFESTLTAPPRSVVLVPLLGLSVLVAVVITAAVARLAVTRWHTPRERHRSVDSDGATVFVLSVYALVLAVPVFAGWAVWKPLGVFLFVFGLAGVPVLVLSPEPYSARLGEMLRLGGIQSPALVVLVASWRLLSLVPEVGFLLAYTTVSSLAVGLGVVVYEWHAS